MALSWQRGRAVQWPLDVVATLGLVFLFAAVSHIHSLTAQPLASPAVMTMLALVKLFTTPQQNV